MKQEERKTTRKKQIGRMPSVILSIICVVLLLIALLMLHGCGSVEEPGKEAPYAENAEEIIEVSQLDSIMLSKEESKQDILLEEKNKTSNDGETMETQEAVQNREVREHNVVSNKLETVASTIASKESGECQPFETAEWGGQSDKAESTETIEAAESMETTIFTEGMEEQEAFEIKEQDAVSESLETEEGKTVSDVSGKIGEQESECIHDYRKSYWPTAPTCANGADYVMICSKCGDSDGLGYRWEDALPHTPVGREENHGNCVEYTIIVTECCVCGLELSRDGYYEEEHDWVEGTYEEFNLETLEWENKSSIYCSRCGKHQ